MPHPSCEPIWENRSSSVHQYDVLPVDATTTSLEALQDFQHRPANLPERRTALQTHPVRDRAAGVGSQFLPLAYTSLYTSYYNLNQIDLSMAAISKAFELRDRVTERRERSHITHLYYDIATGEPRKSHRRLQAMAANLSLEIRRFTEI